MKQNFSGAKYNIYIKMKGDNYDCLILFGL